MPGRHRRLNAAASPSRAFPSSPWRHPAARPSAVTEAADRRLDQADRREYRHGVAMPRSPHSLVAQAEHQAWHARPAWTSIGFRMTAWPSSPSLQVLHPCPWLRSIVGRSLSRLGTHGPVGPKKMASTISGANALQFSTTDVSSSLSRPSKLRIIAQSHAARIRRQGLPRRAWQARVQAGPRNSIPERETICAVQFGYMRGI